MWGDIQLLDHLTSVNFALLVNAVYFVLFCSCFQERTGGKIIYRKAGVLYLFRGRNYNYKTRPRFPLMLWKPVTPVYPRLIQRVPEGLTLEEASEMRKKGRKLIPICKLGRLHAAILFTLHLM